MRGWPEPSSPIFFGGIDPGELAPLMVEAAKRWCVAFCAMEQLGAYQAATGPAWVRAGVWVKPNSAPQFSGDRPAQAAEGVAIMHRKGKKTWNGGGSRAAWFNPRPVTGKSGHPTEKPVKLMMDLICSFTDPDDLILDPFAGSGATGVAALRAGRRVCLIEKDPVWAAHCQDRMRSEAAGVDMQRSHPAQLAMGFDR